MRSRERPVARPSTVDVLAHAVERYLPPIAREIGIDLLDRMDAFSGIRNGLRMIAAERREWAGIPMPLDGKRLVIEPKYRDGAALSKIGAPEKPEVSEEDKDVKLRNRWRSYVMPGECYIYEEKGKIKGFRERHVHNFGTVIETLSCSEAWGIEQESNAVQTLGALLPHRMFKTYMLTGMFIETSKRSKISYVFRRLRPTVALSSRGAEMRILACLCMHPIAYYEGTFAGGMCPTDDIIAHLMLMRGDERLFWARSNQHPPGSPLAGL